jgi:hypothetical protein
MWKNNGDVYKFLYVQVKFSAGVEITKTSPPVVTFYFLLYFILTLLYLDEAAGIEPVQ